MGCLLTGKFFSARLILPVEAPFFKSYFGQMCNYLIYSSPVVIREIENADEDTKAKLFHLIKKYVPVMLEVNEEIDELADVYIREKIVPEKKRDDALHIAIATVNELDALVSWNYRHLANLVKKEKVHSVNITQGYLKELEMITPMEVIGDE